MLIKYCYKNMETKYVWFDCLLFLIIIQANNVLNVITQFVKNNFICNVFAQIYKNKTL